MLIKIMLNQDPKFNTNLALGKAKAQLIVTNCLSKS